MTFGMASACEAETGEDLDQEPRWHHQRVDAREEGAGQARAPQVIRRLAAVVVQQHRPSERACHQNRRQRRQQERGVGSREDVDHVGAAQLTPEPRPVGELRDERAHVPEARGPRQAPRRRRIDRHEPGLDPGVIGPFAQDLGRLHRLAADDAERSAPRPPRAAAGSRPCLRPRSPPRPSWSDDLARGDDHRDDVVERPVVADRAELRADQPRRRRRRCRRRRAAASTRARAGANPSSTAGAPRRPRPRTRSARHAPPSVIAARISSQAKAAAPTIPSSDEQLELDVVRLPPGLHALGRVVVLELAGADAGERPLDEGAPGVLEELLAGLTRPGLVLLGVQDARGPDPKRLRQERRPDQRRDQRGHGDAGPRLAGPGRSPARR